MNDHPCPNCTRKLQPFKISEGIVWTCEGCAGLWTNAALLRRHSDKGTAEELWRLMRASGVPAAQRCPGCANAMTGIHAKRRDDRNATVPLTGCFRCQAFWFDRGELEQLRLSFGGRARESLAPPHNASAVDAADSWLPLAGYEVAWILDGLDLDFGN